MSYKKISGIYKITNTINNKSYIGSAVNVYYRLNTHKRLLRNNKHFNKHLQSSYNKYGLDIFSFELLEECLQSLLLQREQYWIDTLLVVDPNKGYNKRLLANSNLGIKASEYTKEKLRISHLGHKRSKETQEKISESQRIPIVQIDFDGNIVQKYPSLQDAVKVTGILSNGISMCLNKTIKSTGGYCWCKEKDIDEFVLPKINHKYLPKNIKEKYE